VAIKMRRRRRLRLAAVSRRCSRRAAIRAGGAGTGGESGASGGALTPGSAPDRRRPCIRGTL